MMLIQNQVMIITNDYFNYTSVLYILATNLYVYIHAFMYNYM